MLALLFACGTSTDPPIATTFDVCLPIVVDAPEATEDELASLDDAMAMWRDHGVAGLSRAASSSDAHVVLRFQSAAANFHGLYDDAAGVIYVNTALTDRRARAITIAHELGHSFGLFHIARDERESVMNPANLSVAPDAADTAAVQAIWGDCR